MMSITPSQGTCSFDAGTDLIACNIGSLTAGQVETVTAVVRPKWMSAPPGNRSLANTATISTSTAQTDTTNDSKGAALAITFAQVDLIANVTDVSSFVGINPDPLGFDTLATSNNVITYRARITNAGPSEATGVKFTSTYTPPAGRTVTFMCDSTDQYSCTGSSVCSLGSSGTVTGTPLVLNCTAPNLQAAGAFTHYLRYSIGTAPASTGDSYSNSISATPNEPEASSGNNTAAEPTAVRAKADLRVISKTALISSPPLQYGQAFKWQIRVDNAGPGSAVDYGTDRIRCPRTWSWRHPSRTS